MKILKMQQSQIPGGDLDKINDFLSKNNLKLVKIFLTHGHLDHAGGAFNLSQEHDVKIEGLILMMNF